MTDDTAIAVGALLSGRYRLRFLIASGGMADVWCADDEVLGRPVAIKILHPHMALDPALRARFRTEAVAAARLVHPAIVAIFDTCDAGDSEAIVMEFIRGRTLREYLDERGRLEPIEVQHIGAEVAAALACAHRGGIIHRDIKPANILLSDDGRVLVTDFGIAKVLDEPDLTRTDQLIGTVKYLAPEQVDGRPIDARTDIYALGAVLHEALTGQAPFTGETPAAVALARIQRDPLPPSFTVDGIPPDLDRVIMRALARNPDDRPAQAADLRAALLSIRPDDHDPTVAMGRPAPLDATEIRTEEPAGPHDRSRGRGSRSLVVVTLVVVAALIVVALLISGTGVGRTLFADPTTTTTSAPAATIALAGARSFDPEGSGDPTESEATASLAIDGSDATGWSTEIYATRSFGNLKSGVGLILDLASVQQLDRLTILSPTTGWAVEVLASTTSPSPTSRSGWGLPVASASNIQSKVSFDLHGTGAREILIWITDLGDGPENRVELTEVSLGGPGH